MVEADDDVRALVTDALQWNEIRVMREVTATAKSFDPLENPSGFCEELPARLSDPNATLGEPID